MPKKFYSYKNNIYRKIDDVSVKNPVTREWQPYIAYQSKEGNVYVREKKEFEQLFVEVNAEDDMITEFEKADKL